jgi:hypothetical protein
VTAITMIPKGQKDKSNPINYRPISLISCLSKLMERIMAQRLKNFLESNQLIIKEQSGFRTGRRTTDNLIFLTQKVSESLAKGEKVVSLFFDIEAAFDAVWQKGILYKMIKLGVPTYLVRWTSTYLDKRSFVIRVGDYTSESGPILAGVPQGSAISPTLFSIFINDVPIRNKTDRSFSLLFADDLNTFFIFKNNLRESTEVGAIARGYLREMETWLGKWRLNMAPSKCQFTVFGNGKNEKLDFGLTLFGGKIPYEVNPTSLGIVFDSKLNFKAHITKLKEKCASRLNIIKIISHKSWGLATKTLTAVYSSLVGSCLDYSALMCSQINKALTKTVQAVQNTAVRSIFHHPFDAHMPTASLCVQSGLTTVRERATELIRRFLVAANASSNELILQLQQSYLEKFPVPPKNSTPLCEFRAIFSMI